MTQRTRPDSNQKEIEEAINWQNGCLFIDTHDVPANLPELSGFPDGLIVNQNAITVFSNDPDAIVEAIHHVPGVSIWRGGIVPVEIKTKTGKIRDSQKAWSDLYGVKQIILRTIEDVRRMFNGE